MNNLQNLSWEKYSHASQYIDIKEDGDDNL